MTIFIDGHSYGYELQRVTQLFYPGEKAAVAQGAPPLDFNGAFLYTRLGEGKITVTLGREDGSRESAWMPETENRQELDFAVLIFRLLSEETGFSPPWGVLTGIRPVKLFLSAMRAGEEEPALRRRFIKERLLEESRFSLALTTARCELPLLAQNHPRDFSLYVSIPFCPTRCAYCSFVSHSIEKAAALLPEYLNKLCEELTLTARIARELGLRLQTVYFGGGTPTVLDPEQLDRLFRTVEREFDLGALREYTVEAGRPDTVTPEKFRVMKEAGIQRISINPQTLTDSVLRAIGRRHTAEETIKAFRLARREGFENINMDLIAGLPTDTLEGFGDTLDKVLELAPENITVHTLTVKRAARMTFEESRAELLLARKMVDDARQRITDAGYMPYYLYRQTGSLCGLENVGYAKPGKEGLYNIYIMDESHTILAVGAGASTKLCRPGTGEIARIYNYKYPYEYLERFDMVKRRKEKIKEFFRPGSQSYGNLKDYMGNAACIETENKL